MRAGSAGAVCVAVGIATVVASTFARSRAVVARQARDSTHAPTAAFSLFGLALALLGFGLVIASPPIGGPSHRALAA